MNEQNINDEVLVKYLLGEASIFERKSVEQWINAKPENEKYFNHFQLIWEASKKVVIPDTVNPDDAWKRFQQRQAQGPKEPALVKQMSSRRGFMRAASIALMIGGLAAIAYLISDLYRTPVTISSSTGPVRDTLPDGSYVILNKNSSISYPPGFKGNQRRIQLDGEAFFSITPDKRKPFIISVNGITVTVVGTSFNIKSVRGKTQVVVETGVVRVTRNNETVELRPGEKVVATQTDSAMIKEEVTDQLHKYYRTREFVCDSTPLWKLVEVLNEAYNSNIRIGNDKLRNLPLTTTFYNESLDNILDIIGETFEISVERHDGKIILK